MKFRCWLCTDSIRQVHAHRCYRSVWQNRKTDICSIIPVQIFPSPINRKQGGYGGARLDKFGCRTGCPGSAVYGDKIRSCINSKLNVSLDVPSRQRNLLEIQASRFVIFFRLFTRRTFRWRLGSFVDITADAAFPFDCLFAFEDSSGLDHFQQFFISRSVVCFDFSNLFECHSCRGFSFFFGIFGKPGIHTVHFIVFTAFRLFYSFFSPFGWH